MIKRVMTGAWAVVALMALAARGEDVPLFNGKDLSNWEWVSQDGATKMEDVWSVKEDGVLACKGTPLGYIRTKADYTSYVLTVEWRFTKPGNGGVLLRMNGPDKVWPKSIECQLLHQNAGDIWNIDQFPMEVDASRTEGRRTKKMKECNEKPIGQWNKYEITIDGENLKLVVNGELQNTATKCQVVAGKICLQSEGAAAEYRNIVLRPIEKPAGDQSSSGKR